MICRVCRSKADHRPADHTQRCRLCGGSATMVKDFRKVDRTFTCNRATLHERLRSGFGDPALVRLDGHEDPGTAELSRSSLNTENAREAKP